MTNDLDKLKYFSVIILVVMTSIAGLLPVYYGRALFFHSRMISIGNCFTAGIFLTMGLSHILLEASEDERDPSIGNWLSGKLHLHIFLMTFVAILGIECIVSNDDDRENTGQPIIANQSPSHLTPVEMKLMDNSIEARHELEGERQTEQGLAKDIPINQKYSFANFVLISSAMSIHSMSTGIALGVQHDYNSVLSVLVGMQSSKISHTRS